MRLRRDLTHMLAALAAVANFGCSSSDTPRCTPGQSIPCACASGASGAQVCLPNATYAACTCAVGGDAAVSLTDSATLPDSTVPTDSSVIASDLGAAVEAAVLDIGNTDTSIPVREDAPSANVDVPSVIDVVASDAGAVQPLPCLAPGLCNIVQLTLAHQVNAARLSNGEVWTWQFILHTPPTRYRATAYASLASSDYQLCGISTTDSGRVYCGVESSGGVRVADFMGAVAVAATRGRFFGINAAGELWSWDPSAMPLRGSLVAGVSNARELIAGPSKVCIRGTSPTWQCSANGTTFAPAPEYDDAVSMTLTSGEPTSGSECVVRRSGALACRGNNTVGQLGLGSADTDIRSTFVAVPGITDAVRVVSAKESLGYCVLRASGAVLCWGDGATIGDGVGMRRSSPTQVVGVSDAVGLWGRTSYAHRVCAQRANGRLVCWGTDSPTNTISPFLRSSPVEVGGLPSP